MGNEKICTACNKAMNRMDNVELKVYNYFDDTAHHEIGWCLEGVKPNTKIFGKETRIKMVPVPYMCPNCRKVEFYLSEEDYNKFLEFDKIQTVTWR